MSAPDAVLDECARALFSAHRTGQRAVEPSRVHPGFTVRDGYAVQRRLIDQQMADGQRAVGWKVGMASVTAPAEPGPIYGRLLSGMAVPDAGTLRCSDLHEPVAEGEIAVELAADLRGPGIGEAEVLAATRGLRPAIEIYARRLPAAASNVADMVADNALSAAYVLGAGPTPAAGFDPALLGAVVRRDGAIVGTGAGAQVLGSPLRVVAWLANSLGARGEWLRAGEVVLTGAVAGAFPAVPGERFEVTIDRLGSTAVSFT